MAKERRQFVCQECGYVSLKWLGRCPDCQKWNSLTEEIEFDASSPGHRTIGKPSRQPETIGEIAASEEDRLLTGIREFDRVLGDGIVPGSVTLIGGDPGIGKSTLLLQASDAVSRVYGTVLYVTGEESAAQTKLRANRLGLSSEALLVLCENDLEQIEAHIAAVQPSMVVIDSIQAVYLPALQSAPGSVTQIRECAGQLLILAKSKDIPVVLVGHVTKDGALAGPRMLEHIVDTVLYFEGEQQHIYRVLRAVKNRFGSTNEIGIFEMLSRGLVDVENPSVLFLGDRQENVSGSVVVSSIEGTRPLLLELQALVSPSNFAFPRNTTAGVDRQKIAMLVAVLHKRIGMNVGDSDVFVNITGGVRIDEPGIDLGIVIAIVSNHRDIAVDPYTVLIGEVGLGGEVRPVAQIDKRLREAAKLGFKRAILPETNRKGLDLTEDIELFGAKNLHDVLGILF
ncbi:MAG: DNA repair protein RadA [Candidatus Poribacteria bacterium]|nr:DNA repair protein RadA [Candidatus Poribacteria bacterium]MDE0503835.1 DNA repair protein RadA [Candidatus Poribacteria bacterium]